MAFTKQADQLPSSRRQVLRQQEALRLNQSAVHREEAAKDTWLMRFVRAFGRAKYRGSLVGAICSRLSTPCPVFPLIGNVLLAFAPWLAG